MLWMLPFSTFVLCAEIDFSLLVPELYAVTVGGNVTLHCPCSDSVHWCIANRIMLPRRLYTESNLTLSWDECVEEDQSPTSSRSVTIGDIPASLSGSMVYCAHQCNGPLTIVGGTKLLHIPGVRWGKTLATQVPQYNNIHHSTLAYTTAVLFWLPVASVHNMAIYQFTNVP